MAKEAVESQFVMNVLGMPESVYLMISCVTP